MTQSSNQAEIRQAIQDAQASVRDAAQSALEAAQTARDAARTARDAARAAGAGDGVSAPDAPSPAEAPLPPGTIVIPTDGPDPDIHISVDGRGIHVQQGTTNTTLPIHDVVPKGAVQIAWAIPATLSVLLIWWPLSRAVIGWLRRKSAIAQDTAALEARLRDRFETMERNIDTVAIELEKLAEGQRFTNKLIAERQTGVPPVAVPVNVPVGAPVGAPAGTPPR